MILWGGNGSGGGVAAVLGIPIDWFILGVVGVVVVIVLVLWWK
jgi:hypothetical protein